MRCDECRFWDKTAYDEQSGGADNFAVEAFCRRYPPQINVSVPLAGVSEGFDAADTKYPYNSYTWPYPVTEQDDWCGEFQSKEDYVAAAKPLPSVYDLGLSWRVRNGLRRAHIHTVEELLQCTSSKLLEIRNFGLTSINEVQEGLGKHGLRLLRDTF